MYVLTCSGEIYGVKHIATVGPTTVLETNVDAADDHDPSADLTWAWDDVSGAELDVNEVKKARAVEMDHVAKKEVWTPITRATAQANGWKVVPTRWIDINKGDRENPVHRSRFVAKEFNTGSMDGLFAATPPLEAARLLLSVAASQPDAVVMINDVSRAFFEAPASRTVCIELPRESPDYAEGVVGLLKKSLYGTRDAAANFQAEVVSSYGQPRVQPVPL